MVHNDSTGLTVWQNAFGLAKIDGITRIQEATRTMTKLHLSWRSVRVVAMDLDLFLTLPDRCRPTLLSSLVRCLVAHHAIGCRDLLPERIVPLKRSSASRMRTSPNSNSSV